MGDLTLLVRQKIMDDYGSISNFARHIGIPVSTVTSALRNGVESTGFDTVIKILNALGIESEISVKTEPLAVPAVSEKNNAK